MEKLIELLQQIQDLAGVAIDALKGAKGDAEGGDKPEGGKPPEGGPPHEGGKPPEGGPPHEGAPPHEGGDRPAFGHKPGGDGAPDEEKKRY